MQIKRDAKEAQRGTSFGAGQRRQLARDNCGAGLARSVRTPKTHSMNQTGTITERGLFRDPF